MALHAKEPLIDVECLNEVSLINLLSDALDLDAFKFRSYLTSPYYFSDPQNPRKGRGIPYPKLTNITRSPLVPSAKIAI